MKENRAPTSVWMLRKGEGAWVRTMPGDEIQIGQPGRNGWAEVMTMSRRDARLLAKRINECLDAT